MLEKKTIQAEEMKAIIDKHAVAPYDDEKLPSGKPPIESHSDWNGSVPTSSRTGE